MPLFQKLAASIHALPNTAPSLTNPLRLINPLLVSTSTPILPSQLPFFTPSPITPNPLHIFILASPFSLAFLNVLLSKAFLTKFIKKLMAGELKLSLKQASLSSLNQWL
jgi:hypothetical protein